MTPKEKQFMALEGLVQWTSAVIAQADRLTAAQNLMKDLARKTPEARRATTRAIHTEANFFVTAAWKLFEYRKWATALGICTNIDFSAIDVFDTNDLRDLRNMREHVVEYFQGAGNNQNRWFKETPDYKADASSMVGTQIGGRLDWKAFYEAAMQLLPLLLKEPMPT